LATDTVSLELCVCDAIGLFARYAELVLLVVLPHGVSRMHTTVIYRCRYAKSRATPALSTTRLLDSASRRREGSAWSKSDERSNIRSLASAACADHRLAVALVGQAIWVAAAVGVCFQMRAALVVAADQVESVELI
jgi:hypothetical protein